MQTIDTRCCVAGGGPAGIMAAYLLARMGVDTVVLEKHKDFLRDFRGDTIHPSTLEVLYEMGILGPFLRRPHQKIRELAARVGRETVTAADFTHLPTHCKFVALMPQWDFLDFLCEQATRYSTFHLLREAEVTELITRESGEVAGVRARTPRGPIEVLADLTIGADGRNSVVRELAGLPVRDLGSPIDVLWMRLSRREEDPLQTFGHVDTGHILVLINRDTYWQMGLVVAKGEADQIRERGLAAFRDEIAHLTPFLADRVNELRDWRDVSLLTVRVDRIEQWSRAGLLCIGDAAHAMSPVGAVGINLAIQDAVAAANMLGPILAVRAPSESELYAVQRRRTFPTVMTQRMQVFIQNRIIRRVLESQTPLSLPWPLKLLRRWPFLRRIPARVIGMGFRPEHVDTPQVLSSSDSLLARPLGPHRMP
jgi:2-polyprenyl-6-methoxyphenol hydroxylase-like FAD-dependent oxidoreductase